MAKGTEKKFLIVHSFLHPPRTHTLLGPDILLAHRLMLERKLRASLTGYRRTADVVPQGTVYLFIYFFVWPRNGKQNNDMYHGKQAPDMTRVQRLRECNFDL